MCSLTFSVVNTLFEFVEKKELLETPAERTRLLKKFPEVTRDEEVEAEAVSFCFEDAEVETVGAEKHCYL